MNTRLRTFLVTAALLSTSAVFAADAERIGERTPSEHDRSTAAHRSSAQLISQLIAEQRRGTQESTTDASPQVVSGLEHTNKAIHTSADANVYPKLLAALFLVSAGQTDAAINLYRTLHAASNIVYVKLEAAKGLLNLGESIEAENIYHDVLKDPKSTIDEILIAAWYLIKLGKSDLATDAYQKIVGADSEVTIAQKRHAADMLQYLEGKNKAVASYADINKNPKSSAAK